MTHDMALNVNNENLNYFSIFAKCFFELQDSFHFVILECMEMLRNFFAM